MYFEDFYEAFISFGFYNSNYMGRVRNQTGWEKKVSV